MKPMKPGYPGKDAMREEAERAVGKHFFEAPLSAPPTRSNVNDEKPRFYKKGGSVKKKMDGVMESKAPAKAKQTSALRRAVKGRTKKEGVMESGLKMGKGGKC